MAPMMIRICNGEGDSGLLRVTPAAAADWLELHGAYRGARVEVDEEPGGYVVMLRPSRESDTGYGWLTVEEAVAALRTPNPDSLRWAWQRRLTPAREGGGAWA